MIFEESETFILSKFVDVYYFTEIVYLKKVINIINALDIYFRNTNGQTCNVCSPKNRTF